MDSNLFSYIGMGSLDPAYLFIGMLIVILVLVVLTIVTMVKIGKLNKKYGKFMQGKNAKSMEKEIMALFEDIKHLKISADKNRSDIKKIFNNLLICYQKVGLVKYDAFQEMGGQLSFSLALLNDNNDGFIINSVHSSDGCYTYTKEIKRGECKISLGEEEKKALGKAMSITAKKPENTENISAEGKPASQKSAVKRRTSPKKPRDAKPAGETEEIKKQRPFDVVKELEDLEEL